MSGKDSKENKEIKTSIEDNKGHRERLKQRFMRAPEAVHDAEVIELLLGYVIRGRDVKPESKALMRNAKSIANIFENDLTHVKGIGKETLIFFEVLKEFIARINYKKLEEKPVDLSESESVYQFLKTKIGNSPTEMFAILFLDAKNCLKSYKLVRSGFVNSVSIHARDVITGAMAANAVSAIIAHNHPTGDPKPSPSDLLVTKQICFALQYSGITLLDHIVVCKDSYYSMNSRGDIKRFKDEIARLSISSA